MWFSKKAPVPEVAQVEHRHPSAHPQGGFNLSLGDSSDVQAVTGSIFKQMGSKLMTGDFKEIMKFSKPISMSYPMSFLNSIANEHVYCSILEQHADGSVVEQISDILTYLIAGLHANGPIIKLKAPLDPQLGETLHLIKDGLDYFAEQISLDPPQARFQIIGKRFEIHGVHSLSLAMTSLNSLSAEQSGTFTVKFQNGNTYKCVAPIMHIQGLVMGDRIMNFSNKIEISGEDHTATALLSYNPEGVMKKLSSFIWGSQQSTNPSDYVSIVIKQQDNVLLEGKGSWLEDISIDNTVQWKITDAIDHWREHEDVLDSDSTRRPDLVCMRDNRPEDAQVAKLELESRIRQDLILRQQMQQQ